MRSFASLLFIKNKWGYVYTILSVIVLAVLFQWVLEKQKQVALPIGIQDLSHSTQAEAVVRALKQSEYRVTEIDETESFPTKLMESQQVVALLVIPKDYGEKIQANKLKRTLPLYVQENVSGTIAKEGVSFLLFEQQVPYLIQKHLAKAFSEQSIEPIIQQYERTKPKEQLVVQSSRAGSPTSVLIGSLMTTILLVFVFQIIWNRHLFQGVVWQKIKTLRANSWSLDVLYTFSYGILFTVSVIAVAYFIHIPLSGAAIATTLIVGVVYEFGLIQVMRRIQMISHQLFIGFLWAAVVTATIWMVQLGGMI